jgi:FlaA1/EpsC-like NDP-sugar epimerase
MQKICTYLTRRFLPRWLVLLFDLFTIVFSWLLAFLLRYNLEVQQFKSGFVYEHLLVILPVVLFCFWKSKSYSGILRLSTTQDILRIISAMSCTGVLLAVISLTARQTGMFSVMVMPLSVIIIMVFLATTAMIFSRLLAKLIFDRINADKRAVKNVVLFGAGKLGQITRNALETDSSGNFKVVGFIDDNPSLHHKYIAGIPIYSVKKAFKEIIPAKEVSELIFAIDRSKISFSRKREIADLCIKNRIDIKEIPPVKKWINGEFNVKAIQRINIEDLLGRDAIHLNCEKISEELQNSVVLVTGAAGSIGSEIVRQLIGFQVKHVILIDIAETPMFHIINEINSKHIDARFTAIVGDITNRERMENIFSKYRPSIVFNAAAYKHVPLMEYCPCEALRVNVGGTKLLADLSINAGVKKFVFISTDKAVNPTNVMGASKRISEIYIQSLAQSGEFSTRFITTRFGNVLGSNGSVVPLFKKQIESGGPVTVTHKDITRYFMTIPEACQLVLEAGFMGKGGEIFVFDMGKPVRIIDLAEKMIALSGFTPHKDIKIEITGLRPGEKLYEELLDDKEDMLPTHNDKILIGKVRPHDFITVSQKINDLLQNINKKEKYMLVKEMMEIVPEFKPANSLYSNV